MPVNGLHVFLATLFLALVGLAWALLRQRRLHVQAPPAEGTPGAYRGPAAPASDTLPPDGHPCRYCSRPVTRPVPRIEHVRTPLDRLWRSLGLVPVVRWTVDTEPTFDHELCELHALRARTLLEREVADAMVARAEWSDRQTKHLIEYQARGLNEKLLEDCTPQKKVRGPGKPLAPVTPLREVKRPAANGDGG